MRHTVLSNSPVVGAVCTWELLYPTARRELKSGRHGYAGCPVFPSQVVFVRRFAWGGWPH